MKILYTKLYILVALCGCLSATAKNPVTYTGGIQYKDIRIFKQEEKLIIQLYVDLSSLQMPEQLLLTHTPVLRAAGLPVEHAFEPVMVAGRVRNKVLERQREHYLPEGKDPLLYVVHKKQPNKTYPLILSVPYEEWMRDASLTCREQVSGCAGCSCEGDDIFLVDRILPPLHVPSYELQYMMPEVEPIKHRSETYMAHLNFKVGRYELVRDFENNAHILLQIDQTVTGIRNDKNLTIQGMEVTGYASPEGEYNANMELSKNRTRSFVNYLVSTHPIEQSLIKVNWKGEDWEGLAQRVQASSLPEREKVLQVIENNDNISRRKAELKKLNGGNTYKNLLNNYYPPLRRIEYTFSYVARPFDIEEAKEVVQTKPQHLSLHEMFLVANTYEKGSEAFNQLFDIAVRLFPGDPIANLNAAVAEIEMGAYDKAIRRLQHVDTPEAANNLGVAYIKKGDFTQAKTYLQKAIHEGNIAAQANMQELTRFLENN